MTFYGDMGHCPKCGRFCGNIMGELNIDGLQKVIGICKKHGEVDLSKQSWSVDNFEEGDEKYITDCTD